MKRSAPNAALRMPCTGRLARQRAEMAEAIADPMWRAAELGKSRFDAAQEPPPHGLQEAFKVARCARGCQPPPPFFFFFSPPPPPPSSFSPLVALPVVSSRLSSLSSRAP
eukprot:COSAG01_NODE_20452_length_952_cov_1.607268_3_plen_109_part_01